MSAADLLTLQGSIKKDADGYKEEFYLQYRHYQALIEIFQLSPSKDSKELGELAMFVAQVCKAYPKTTEQFAPQLMALLEAHHLLLEPSLRRSLVQALILLRNRSQLTAAQLLPLFFKLFKCQDKALRLLLFKHMITDIKSSNKKHRNDKLNRQLQSFMYGVVADDDEQAAKKALAVCTELWRRHVWRDARTVNVIASATYHKSSRVMLAAVKFFLGTDKSDEDLEEEEKAGQDGDEPDKPQAPTKEAIYKSLHSGTRSSKRKKQAKLKRVMATVKKAERKDGAKGNEGFAALQLLHDPQTFAERMFGRLQSGNERFETRMAMMAVISRVIGVHKLLVLNFYPFLQKYVAPHTRDVTLVLAALVGASHELVPPDVMAPVLRQLVDQFVHDRARPEVMTLGLKTVRELCLRCPLIMQPDLLSDLVEYKKYRNKYVASAAKGLISLFRELQPEMLAKKDRGRGADLKSRPAVYGAVQVAERVDGADLLQAAEAAGQHESDDEVRLGSEDDSDVDMSEVSEGDDDPDMGLEEAQGEGEEGSDEDGEGEEEEDDSDMESLNSEDLESLSGSEGMEDMEEGSSGEEDAEEEEGAGPRRQEANGRGNVEAANGQKAGKRKRAEADDGEKEREQAEEEEGAGTADLNGDGEVDEASKASHAQRVKKKAVRLAPQKESLSALKKRLAEARQRKQEEEEAAEEERKRQAALAAPQHIHIEEDRIFTEEDFERIKRLKQKQLVEAAMAKHGVKATTKAKRARLLEAAEEEAEETLALRDRLAVINETKINPRDLESKRKRGHDKEARLATVMAGREGRDKFGSSKGRKKDKTGGLSERQKQRNKEMPVVARLQQLRNRAEQSRNKNNPKNYKGHHKG